jgi:hypothetical protein
MPGSRKMGISAGIVLIVKIGCGDDIGVKVGHYCASRPTKHPLDANAQIALRVDLLAELLDVADSEGYGRLQRGWRKLA